MFSFHRQLSNFFKHFRVAEAAEHLSFALPATARRISAFGSAQGTGAEECARVYDRKCNLTSLTAAKTAIIRAQSESENEVATDGWLPLHVISRRPSCSSSAAQIFRPNMRSARSPLFSRLPSPSRLSAQLERSAAAHRTACSVVSYIALSVHSFRQCTESARIELQRAVECITRTFSFSFFHLCFL